MSADIEFGHRQWVQQLPADFYCQPANVHPRVDPVMMLTVGVDLAIRTGLSVFMAAASIPSGYSSTKLISLIRDGSHMGDCSDDELFHQPRPLPKVEVTETLRPKGVVGGTFEQLQWPSLYRSSVDPVVTNNDQAVAWLWRHGDKPRPTIVLVHGFLAPWWEVNEFYLGIRFLYELGCDVVLKTMPHHGPRAQTESLVSGMSFFTSGVDVLNHAVVQSTYDIRTLVDVLQHNGVEKIGLSGVSLGGYTTALMAGLDERFEFVMPLVPLVSIPDAIMAWKPLDRVAKTFMQRYNVSMEELRNTMAFHSPLARPALLPSKRLLIISGMGDCMATPRHSETLQRHWGNCDLHWHNGAHALPRQHQQTNVVKQAFLSRIGFI